MNIDEFERYFRGPPELGGPFTIASPIRYDAWRAYALAEGGVVDLILEMEISFDQRDELKRTLDQDDVPTPVDPMLSGGFGLGIVAMKVPFETFLRVVVPLTGWRELISVGRALTTAELAAQLTYALSLDRRHTERPDGDPVGERASEPLLPIKVPDEIRNSLIARFRWFILLAVRIGYLDQRGADRDLDDFATSARSGSVRWLQRIFTDAVRLNLPEAESISENRRASVAVRSSSMTVKSDAARRVFDVDASSTGWAVLDTGIDALHPAFIRRDENGQPVGAAFEEEINRRGLKRVVNNTRVRATYDLVNYRSYLSDVADQGYEAGLLGTKIPSDQVPTNDHGTHVAGILAGDWPETKLTGIVPDLELYDLRVLDDDGLGDEVAVIAGLRLVRAINEDAGRLVIHGVNLSLSIRHRVRNFACGWTPVCRAAEDLVDTGVVVVAAAGNTGFTPDDDQFHSLGEGFNLMSITDPGNAEKVITVGGTDRLEPYRFGTSYFSARGPTADGRPKPDLLAPGQNIAGPVPGNSEKTYDGTSQAAPHVSGVAALLLARYPELRGRPDRVKSILCNTANDLGRDRYFQGHGLVDALRALQSI